jgi:hypothetical protein
MSDLIQEGADWLAGQLEGNASQSVTYSRGVDEVALDATVGSTDRESMDESGTSIKSKIRDYIIRTSKLILNENPILPERGDKIKQVVGTQTFTYEVIEIGGDKHYSPMDPAGTMLRIHTQLIDVNP